MLAVRYGCIALLMLAGIGLAPLPGAAQTESRANVLPGAGANRIDRTIVSPFAGDRRIVVRPGPDGGAEVVAVGATFDAPAALPLPVAAPVPAAARPLPAAEFIDIGPLDAAPVSPPPAPISAPAPQGEFLDIGPYVDPVAPFPVPASSFPPD